MKSVAPRGCAHGFGVGALLAAAGVDLVRVAAVLWPAGGPAGSPWPMRTDSLNGSPPARALPRRAITSCMCRVLLTYDDAVKFVMVPGGWQGGWAFDSVAAELHRDGHDVEAVTLSGLELDGPVDVDRPPNLDTHIDQVAEIIDRSEETPLALCGHSYGGMVIAGVADRLGDRLDQLVFIDAYVPDDGDSCWSLTSDSFRELFIAGARADGRWVAVPDGLDPRARPHPLASFVQSIRLGGIPSRALGRTFISGGAWAGSPFVTLTERLRNDSGWRVHEIPVGHNIARRDPHGLAAVLGALAPDSS